MKYWILGCLAVFATGCTSMKESSEQVLQNAKSVVQSGKEKMWVTPEGSVGTPAEAGAGQVLENAASVVRTAGETIWIPVEEIEERKGLPVAENTYQGVPVAENTYQGVPVAENTYQEESVPQVQY
jgi:hypothetical protein